jgi:hypothetical protein
LIERLRIEQRRVDSAGTKLQQTFRNRCKGPSLQKQDLGLAGALDPLAYFREEIALRAQLVRKRYSHYFYRIINCLCNPPVIAIFDVETNKTFCSMNSTKLYSKKQYSSKNQLMKMATLVKTLTSLPGGKPIFKKSSHGRNIF